MIVASVSEPGTPDGDNEDRAFSAPGLIVVLDGATARTAAGCRHGVAWYATRLGLEIMAAAADRNTCLAQAVRVAIAEVAGQHRDCDLDDPGTPSAALGLLRINGDVVEYFVLGDVTVVLDGGSGLQAVTDDRVDKAARPQRDEANRYPIGSPTKDAALIHMKRAELAVRNKPGGFWVAAADPEAVEEALTGQVERAGLLRAAVLTDGGARLVRLFERLGWRDLLDLLETAGPDEAVRRTRALEAADPEGRRWPRNKESDDATIVYVRLRH